jgi:hypothetical protein
MSDVTSFDSDFFSKRFPIDASDDEVLTLVSAYMKTSNLLNFFSVVVNGQSRGK